MWENAQLQCQQLVSWKNLNAVKFANQKQSHLHVNSCCKALSQPRATTPEASCPMDRHVLFIWGLPKHSQSTLFICGKAFAGFLIQHSATCILYLESWKTWPKLDSGPTNERSCSLVVLESYRIEHKGDSEGHRNPACRSLRSPVDPSDTSRENCQTLQKTASITSPRAINMLGNLEFGDKANPQSTKWEIALMFWIKCWTKLPPESRSLL